MADNRDVRAFLKQYYDEKMPGYAVLVTGNWGAGKTWLVKDTLSGTPSIYISLYGVSSTKQLDEEFYRQLHPWRNSKGGRVLGIALKSLLKLTVKLDLNGDGSDETTLSPTVPDALFQEMKKRVETSVIVFDDLERASMPIGDLLGYINQFVEHEGHRVVVIGNEVELDTTRQPELYRRTKEKLLGRTLMVHAEPRAALAVFRGELESTTASSLIDEHEARVIEIHEASGHNNLRHLRQALKLFERILGSLSPSHREHHAITKELLVTTLALSSEFSAGTLLATDIVEVEAYHWRRALKSKSEPHEERFDSFMRKYEGLIPQDLVLSAAFWKWMFQTGLTDAERMNSELAASRHFPKTQPPWRRLWSFFELPDADFPALLAELKGPFFEGKIRDVEELAQTLGVLLRIRQEALVDESADELVKKASEQVQKLTDEELIRQSEAIDEMFDHGATHGLGIPARDTPEFRAFRTSVVERVKAAKANQRPLLALQLAALMKTDAAAFSRKIRSSSSEGESYWNTDIFNSMNTTEFITAISQTDNERLWTINSAFVKRYEHVREGPLLKEADWLDFTSKSLAELADQRKRKLSSAPIGAMAENFARIAGDLRRRTALAQAGVE